MSAKLRVKGKLVGKSIAGAGRHARAQGRFWNKAMETPVSSFLKLRRRPVAIKGLDTILGTVFRNKSATALFATAPFTGGVTLGPAVATTVATEAVYHTRRVPGLGKGFRSTFTGNLRRGLYPLVGKKVSEKIIKTYVSKAKIGARTGFYKSVLGKTVKVIAKRRFR